MPVRYEKGIKVMDKKDFIGAWKLVSFILQKTDGSVSYPYGEKPAGHIFYMADGYMAVSIMSADRPQFATQDSLDGTTAERAAAMATFLSYCGTFEVQGNEVVHHIEVCLFPNWSGRDQRRYYQFEGRRLILRTAPQVYQGSERTAQLVWERVGEE